MEPSGGAAIASAETTRTRAPCRRRAHRPSGCECLRHVRPPVLSVSGRVGPLRVDVSHRRDVIAFAGRPDAERRGRSPVWPRGGRYDALGYGCGGRPKSPLSYAFPLVHGGPWCSAVFLIETRSGRLGLFYTTDSRYRESHGVRVGMATAVAERLLRRRLHEGCEANIYLLGPKASLTIVFNGKAMVTHRNRTVSGGHVYALVVHGNHHDLGVFECT